MTWISIFSYQEGVTRNFSAAQDMAETSTDAGMASLGDAAGGADKIEEVDDGEADETGAA